MEREKFNSSCISNEQEEVGEEEAADEEGLLEDIVITSTVAAVCVDCNTSSGDCHDFQFILCKECDTMTLKRIEFDIPLCSCGTNIFNFINEFKVCDRCDEALDLTSPYFRHCCKCDEIICQSCCEHVDTEDDEDDEDDD